MELQEIGAVLLVALGTLSAISFALNRIIEVIKPRIQAAVGDTHFNTVMRVISLVSGMLIAGFFPQINIFTGMLEMFYGYPIPPLFGAIVTGLLIGGASNFWYELGRRYGTGVPEVVVVTDGTPKI